MASVTTNPCQRFLELGRETRGEVDLSRFLAETPGGDGPVGAAWADERLAEVIEHDGRMRLARGRPVTLDRYTEAVPDLMQRPVALDAAIDVALRWLSRSSHAHDEAIAEMIEQYPHLAGSIRDAAALNNAMWSTTGLRKRVASRGGRELPAEFGPAIVAAVDRVVGSTGLGADESRAIPRYELQQLLGRGAFGQVYLAIDRQLSDADHPALVAVKILDLPHGDDDRTMDGVEPRTDSEIRRATVIGSTRRRSMNAIHRQLAEEATKARRVDHPNVVRVLDRGLSENGEEYIVYEYVDGGDLEHWMARQQGPIPIRKAVELTAAIARGVQAAHSAGLVHCDLKPGNIMLTADGRPKVADFGIAIRFGESLSDLQRDSEDRHPLGNLAYISPEQYRMDDDALTAPSDIYALGGILFTLLTGELPNGSSLEAIARTHHPERGRTSPPSARSRRPQVDRDLEKICQRALEPQAERRYSAAGTLADDLEAWLRHEPVYWTKPGLGRLMQLWTRRRPAMAAAVGVCCLLAITGAAVAMHFASQAREQSLLALEKDQQRQIEQIRADEEAARMEMVRQQTNVALQRVRQQYESYGSTYEVLPFTWALEHILRSNALATPDNLSQLGEMRFKAVERYVSRAASEDLPNTLEARMWQTNLTFWLIARGELERAESLLSEIVPAWREMLEPNDPWLDMLDVLDAALVARKAIAAAQAEPQTSDADHAEQQLRDMTAFLAQQDEHLAERSPGSPIHLFVIETRRDMAGPALFNRPAEHEALIARHNYFKGSEWRKR